MSCDGWKNGSWSQLPPDHDCECRVMRCVEKRKLEPASVGSRLWVLCRAMCGKTEAGASSSWTTNVRVFFYNSTKKLWNMLMYEFAAYVSGMLKNVKKTVCFFCNPHSASIFCCIPPKYKQWINSFPCITIVHALIVAHAKKYVNIWLYSWDFRFIKKWYEVNCM